MIRVIPSENITKESFPIGRGSFGTVYKGIWCKNGYERIEVALKQLRDEYSEDIEEEFYREAGVMAELDHERIVKLYGICRYPFMMVQELADTSALVYVRKNDIDTEMHLKWSTQIAEGMNYLERERLVHRDLALRNILLDVNKNAKISDFGLTRAMGNQHGNAYYYRMTPGGAMPFKWCAPESITNRHFSSKSDVWSFGVTVWEIFSKGQDPYGNIRIENLIRLITVQNKRLSKPSDCPSDVYQLMKQCWKIDSSQRPSFRSLYQSFRRESVRYEENQRDRGLGAAIGIGVVGGLVVAGLSILGGLAAASNN